MADLDHLAEDAFTAHTQAVYRNAFTGGSAPGLRTVPEPARAARLGAAR
ncbi:hypothetical protein [Streptomyces cavernae]|nr:hypothetical protein [Streptomyces cavernae]